MLLLSRAGEKSKTSGAASASFDSVQQLSVSSPLSDLLYSCLGVESSRSHGASGNI